MLYCGYALLEYFIVCRSQLGQNVEVRYTNAGMDPFSPRVFQRIGGYFYVFFFGSREATNYRFFYGLRYFDDRVEVSRAADGKASFDNINAQGLQRFGNLDFFFSIQLATRHLLAVAQGSVKNMYFLHPCVFINFV